ncbi:hypothetical protein D3C81_1827070 [compost metagenome]
MISDVAVLRFESTFRVLSVPIWMPLYITGVRPACSPSKSLSLTLMRIPAWAASKSSYRRNGKLGSVGGLS